MKAAASYPLAQPLGSIIPIPRYRLKSTSSGQAADTTGPSQTSHRTIFEPLPSQGEAISNHIYA